MHGLIHTSSISFSCSGLGACSQVSGTTTIADGACNSGRACSSAAGNLSVGSKVS